MPSPMPEYLNVHYICESASRLLFLSMHWARSIPAFQALGWARLHPAYTQRHCMLRAGTLWKLCLSVCLRQDCNTSLVRACWNELFTLGLAQCAQVMSLSTILAAIVNHLQNSIQDGTPLPQSYTAHLMPSTADNSVPSHPHCIPQSITSSN